MAEQEYEKLTKLQHEKNFYDYEKSFDDIWTKLGRSVLEKSISDVPADRRKKNA